MALAVGLVGSALTYLLAAYFVLALTLRWRSRTVPRELAHDTARGPLQVRALLATSLVLALVGLTVGSVRAARVPDDIRLTSSESALPQGDPAPTPAPSTPPDKPPVAARYLLSSPVGFSVRLPRKPTESHQDQKSPNGKIGITTWDAEQAGTDDVVQSFVFPVALDPDKLLPLVIDEEKTGFSATVSHRTRGVAGGHKFEQALLTDASGAVVAIRVVAFTHGAIVLLGSPIPELTKMVGSLTITVR